MDKNNLNSNQQMLKIATASLLLGISSLVAFVISIILGFLVRSLGLVNLFGLVSLLAMAAIVCGVIGRKKAITEKLPGSRASTIGLILGGIALFLTILVRIAVFLYFIPWLGV